MQRNITSVQVFRAALLLFFSILLMAPVAQAAPVLGGEMSRFALQNPPKPLPDVSFLDGSSASVKLSDFRGKLVLVTMWATWCPYCMREMPKLEEVQALLGKEKFIVLPISNDKGGPSVVSKFMEEKSLNLPVYSDPKTRVNQALETHGIPYSVLIDQQGRELGRIHGETDWMSAEAIELLKYFMR